MRGLTMAWEARMSWKMQTKRMRGAPRMAEREAAAKMSTRAAKCARAHRFARLCSVTHGLPRVPRAAQRPWMRSPRVRRVGLWYESCWVACCRGASRRRNGSGPPRRCARRGRVSCMSLLRPVAALPCLNTTLLDPRAAGDQACGCACHRPAEARRCTHGAAAHCRRVAAPARLPRAGASGRLTRGSASPTLLQQAFPAPPCAKWPAPRR